MNAVISVQFFPRYKMTGKHMEPVVVEAVRRVRWSNGTVAMETISAQQYEAATGCAVEALCGRSPVRDARPASTGGA